MPKTTEHHGQEELLEDVAGLKWQELVFRAVRSDRHFTFADIATNKGHELAAIGIADTIVSSIDSGWHKVVGGIGPDSVVRASAAILDFSSTPVCIPAHSVGIVTKIDEDGDALTHFASMRRWAWVPRSSFTKMEQWEHDNG